MGWQESGWAGTGWFGEYSKHYHALCVQNSTQINSKILVGGKTRGSPCCGITGV